MAAIGGSDQSSLDMSSLYSQLAEKLPFYARPVFLRVCADELEVTATMKLKKRHLQKEGYDLGRTSAAAGDAVYVVSHERSTYVRLDDKILEEINAGRYKL